MTKKRISTSGEAPREEITGARFLTEADGTCLGVPYENTALAGVNGRRESSERKLLIRVVPPMTLCLGPYAQA